MFEAEKFKVDVSKTPIPRFDLLKFDHYLHVGVQFSRGCPFTCEFCDIIELYGRVPRTKTNAQMLAELDALYQLGYRGHVDFVDDNLIGNKKAVQGIPARPAVMARSSTTIRSNSRPRPRSISPTTPNFLRMMNEANFVGVFVGIESPDPDDADRDAARSRTRAAASRDSIHKIYAAGLFVTCGIHRRLRQRKAAVADAMVELIEEAAIPVCMVGLLYALPNTQLTRRLERGRPPASRSPIGIPGQCGSVHPRV